MSDEVHIPLTAVLRCGECGNDKIQIPEETEGGTVVVCPSCHAELGTRDDLMSSLNEAVEQKASELFADALGEAFEGDDNIRFTKG